ncbi:MAG TPA: zinc-binding alcohol dehydrogenase [Chthoniobacteraceae bacterium]|nr:zinc-binding alcohol dehydrogenase [Chthoniobacteraceae bacterium]
MNSTSPVTSPPSLEARRMVFTGKQQVDLESFELKPPGEGEILVRTRTSLMSTGTENIVFNRLFDPGTHWDRWAKYPFYPGYASVGTVEAVGPGTSVKEGDHVAFGLGHRSHDLLRESDYWPIPAEVPFGEAVWFSLAKIGFMGAKAAEYRLGDRVLIIGAGPIGQMSIRWARAAGAASIIAVDAVAGRLALARQGGATTVIEAPIEQAREQILAANHGALPRVVIDSTGNARVFESALKMAARFGTVVILGDTGQPQMQHLTGDVILRGLTVRGAHATHYTDEWSNTTINRLFFDLARRGDFALSGLISHRFAPEQCREAYELANRDRASTMGIVFDWT